MRLLLDTHIVISHLRNDLDRDYPFAFELVADSRNAVAVSVATIWEIGIKSRLKKLECPVDLDDLEKSGFVVLPVLSLHTVVEIHPDIPTRDPFDRLLVAIARTEGMRLVTVDRALADHPVTFRF
jgi:PIN domain nuclease of toxin-antitoxin system